MARRQAGGGWCALSPTAWLLALAACSSLLVVWRQGQILQTHAGGQEGHDGGSAEARPPAQRLQLPLLQPLREAEAEFCRIFQDKQTYGKPAPADDVHKRIRSVNGAWPGPLGYFGMHGHYFEHGQSWIGYDMVWHAVLPALVAALQRSWSAAGEAPPSQFADGDMYMFGVAQGESMRKLHQYFPGRRSFGFDSFIGLPEEDHSSSKIDPWRKGKFSGRWNQTKLVNSAGGPRLARVIKGFFNESLRPALVEEERMRPAFYVDVDCDLHVSTFAALDFLFANGIALVGTLVGYDDWWTIPCHRFHHPKKKAGQAAAPAHVSPMEVGEGLAHSEIASKHGVVFRCVAGPCRPVANLTRCSLYNNWGPVFIVEAIGAEQGEHGFNFTAEEEAHWVRHMGICPLVH